MSYRTAESGADVTAVRGKLVDSFYLQSNQLTIEYKNVAAADKPVRDELVVTNKKTEDKGRRIMMLHDDPIWTKTTVNIVKTDNTDLISSIGVEVTDRRSELITNSATVIKTLVPLFAAAAGGTPKVCDGVDPATAPCVWQPGAPSGPARNLVVKMEPPSKTAIALDDTPTAYESVAKGRLNGIYYAACRNLKISYFPEATVAAAEAAAKAAGKSEAAGTPTAALVWEGKVADPHYVEFIAFPRKGSVTMHSQCGASVTAEKDPTATADALISATVAQAMAIKDAIDKADAKHAAK
ncbi:hypothetical protein JKL49_11260 [Phenylobacterium sp. 20VBR1]|uniref:Uncharacterized protein n=1 Tax=Phenylobacterium glaciei TaxID=2803784 RepID=A0A941HWM0_9CAUL|nr:hypothetical protein [Phenylobacterium glaciei]MBR7619968.1 hypothetical protein [Phenylobacterium glaciei]